MLFVDGNLLCTYFSCCSQDKMRFISSLMVFSMSSSIDWSLKKTQTKQSNIDISLATTTAKYFLDNLIQDLPNPYNISLNMPECRSTKMCKHSERPQGSRMGMTSVGRAVSTNAEISNNSFKYSMWLKPNTWRITGADSLIQQEQV